MRLGGTARWVCDECGCEVSTSGDAGTSLFGRAPLPDGWKYVRISDGKTYYRMLDICDAHVVRMVIDERRNEEHDSASQGDD